MGGRGKYIFHSSKHMDGRGKYVFLSSVHMFPSKKYALFCSIHSPFGVFFVLVTHFKYGSNSDARYKNTP